MPKTVVKKLVVDFRGTKKFLRAFDEYCEICRGHRPKVHIPWELWPNDLYNGHVELRKNIHLCVGCHEAHCYPPELAPVVDILTELSFRENNTCQPAVLQPAFVQQVF